MKDGELSKKTIDIIIKEAEEKHISPYNAIKIYMDYKPQQAFARQCGSCKNRAKVYSEWNCCLIGISEDLLASINTRYGCRFQKYGKAYFEKGA